MFYLYYLLIDNEEDCIKFDKIVEEYESMMYSVVLSVTKDRYFADEAMQSVLVSIARNISRIKTDNSAMLKSYLYTVAENAGIDEWRRKKRCNRVSNIEDFLDIPSDDNIFENVDGKERAKRLTKLLCKMPVLYREVLVLSLLHGHSLCQIADELDRNYSTVRKQLARGKKILEKLIKEAGINE